MVRLVAAGVGAVMRLSSCSYRQPLDVRIADVAVAMVWECLAVSKVVSSIRALMRWLQTSFMLGDSLEDGQAPANNRRHLLLLQKVMGETLPALPSLQA